jgi:hypothetical protein
MSWRDTGIGRGGKEACDEASDFRGFGIREFGMHELLASGNPDIPMCDEFLLYGLALLAIL